MDFTDWLGDQLAAAHIDPHDVVIEA